MLSDQVAARLRACGKKCGGVSLTIRDPNFRDISRQCRLETPTDLARELTRTAMGLAGECWSGTAPVRALTVTAIYLVDGEMDCWQMDLLGGQERRKEREKLGKLEHCMDQIRAKYGKGAIHPASAATLRSGAADPAEERDEGKT